MNHNKDDVLPASEGLWPEILQGLTCIDSAIFNSKKEHPCPLCGGKTRFRYVKTYETPFFCNHCGSRSGINFYMDYIGCDFSQAINDVGDYLNLIPVDRREAARREHIASVSFPSWYKFDSEQLRKIKEVATVSVSPWQRISGLTILDILSNGDDALLPLLDRNGNAVDFVMVDIDANWQTTSGNKNVPLGFYSEFGDELGKRLYICTTPYHAAHASVFTNKKVICCFEPENIRHVANNFPDSEIVIIVTDMDDVIEADLNNFKQLTFDKKTNRVSRRLWGVGEISRERNK